MSEALVNIGKKIKNYRLKQKITYKKLHNDLKLSIKYFQDIENGNLDERLNFTLTLRYLRSYIDYLNMSQHMITEYKEQYETNIKNNDSYIIEHKKIILPKISIINYSIILLLLFIFLVSSLEPEDNQKLLNKLSPEMKLLLTN